MNKIDKAIKDCNQTICEYSHHLGDECIMKYSKDVEDKILIVIHAIDTFLEENNCRRDDVLNSYLIKMHYIVDVSDTGYKTLGLINRSNLFLLINHSLGRALIRYNEE